MDNSLIVMLVIAALTALSNWMQKKGRAPEGGEGEIPRLPRIPQSTGPPSRPEQPAPQPPQQPEWEKQLRRLLEGDVPDSPPPVAPPPVIVQERRTAPAPPAIRPLPEPPSVPVATVPQPTEGPAFSRLSESESAYTRASQLHEHTATRMRQLEEQSHLDHSKAPDRGRRGASEDIAAAIAMVREPRSVRRAFINSIILGPPKALEN
jgi:hypothetical protein